MASFYENYVIDSSPTGSAYICNPPVTNTDIDTVILAKPGYSIPLLSLGWQIAPDPGYEHGSEFKSYRKANKNYIVTTNPEFYKKFVFATKIAKRLNLLQKMDRVFLFRLIMHGEGLPSTTAVAPPQPDLATSLEMLSS